MTTSMNLRGETMPQRHVVQCYGADAEQLIANVGHYLADGCERGDGLLLIATPAHNEAFLVDAARRGADLATALREHRVVVRDAQEMLDLLMVNGQPDRVRFDIVVGGAIQMLRGERHGRGVRVYGEMVGLLWQAWYFAAALRLEEYWNALLAREDVSLFCAYPIDIFGIEFDPETVHGLLCAHTDLLPTTGNLEAALERAMTDVLGPRNDGHWPHISAHARWGTVPPAEATVLWLRANVPDKADQILRQARQHWVGAPAI